VKYYFIMLSLKFDVVEVCYFLSGFYGFHSKLKSKKELKFSYIFIV
jgi:hypothetical protein